MKTKRNLLTLVCACAFATPSYGALLVYEGFDYTAGTFADGSNGGTGWDAGWTSVDSGGGPTETVLGSSLVSPVTHLASSGGALSVVGSGDRFHRSLASQNIGADGTTIYMSFLARQLGTVNSNGAIELNDGNGGGQNFATFGSDTGGVFGATDKTGTDNDVPIIGSVGTSAPDTNTHLWVVQIDYVAGDDTLTLTYDGVEQGSATMGDLAFDEFGALFFSGTAGMEFDEIRIGTTLADVAVVPEPSSSLLLGLSAIGLIVRRRR